MARKTQIQSVMTICPHSVGLDQEVSVAEYFLTRYQFHHLPVLSAGRLIGVLSDRDVKFARSWKTADGENLLVRDVYTPDPFVVEPTAPLEMVLREMVSQHIGCALVAIERTKLVGIFTVTDACRQLAEMLSTSRKKRAVGKKGSSKNTVSGRRKTTPQRAAGKRIVRA